MDEIKFDKRNYRLHNDENKRVIKKSLKELGAGRSIVIDNEGEQINDYKKNYPNEVFVFHKAGVECDTFDNRKERRVILFARNVAFEVARALGYRYFIELDDDYTGFSTRFTKDGFVKEKKECDLDTVFSAMVDFLKTTNAATIAMAQGGDFVGGKDGKNLRAIKMLRKAMNSFVCDSERQFVFGGRINEDVNTYTTLGSRGMLFFTHNVVMLHQKLTQSNKGGMTGTYIDGGTYIKSFYSVITMPSAVKISVMGNKNMRIHHKISWRNCVPMILRETTKKNKMI